MYVTCELLVRSVAQSYLTLCSLMDYSHQTHLSMEISRQDYWSGLPFPTPRGLPDPGIKPVSLKSPALAVRFFTTSATWEPYRNKGEVENEKPELFIINSYPDGCVK